MVARTEPEPGHAARTGAVRRVVPPTASSCFTVSAKGDETSTPLIERWNGTSWSIEPSPSPAGNATWSSTACRPRARPTASPWARLPTRRPTRRVHRHAASGALGREHVVNRDRAEPGRRGRSRAPRHLVPDASFCVAAGDYEAQATGGALLEQWDGTSWSISRRLRPRHDRPQAAAPQPPFAGAHPVTVRPPPVHTRVAAGRHRLPGQLRAVPGLDGVSCNSSTSCFAVGTTLDGALVEHWDGTSWSFVAPRRCRGRPARALRGIVHERERLLGRRRSYHPVGLGRDQRGVLLGVVGALGRDELDGHTRAAGRALRRPERRVVPDATYSRRSATPRRCSAGTARSGRWPRSRTPPRRADSSTRRVRAPTSASPSATRRRAPASGPRGTLERNCLVGRSKPEPERCGRCVAERDHVLEHDWLLAAGSAFSQSGAGPFVER